MRPQNAANYVYFMFLICLTSSVFSQNIKKDQMKQLEFLIGEWIGISKIYENGSLTKQGAAYEKISYDLDKSILVIKLNSEFLQLRTIVTYHENDKKYYYHRFSKEGTATYPAEFKDGKLIVWKNEKTRFFFGRTLEGHFQEYGEQLINGEWIKTFEDTFKKTL